MFASLLGRLERKPACKARSLETFLTYPMHQVRLNACNVRVKKTYLLYLVDSTLHHYAARAPGAHPARSCGEKIPGTREDSIGRPLKTNAR